MKKDKKWSVEEKLNFQIGVLIGDKIVRENLITLSTDELLSSKVIEVSKELTEQWKEKKEEYRLSNRKTTKATEKFYENRAWYKENIEDVYYPKEIKCHLNFEYTNKKMVFEGIEAALWDCDMSSYKVKEIDSKKYSTYVILELSE